MSDLSWWLSPHPDWEPGEDWPQAVPIVRYETDDAVAVIDPLLPPDDDFDAHGKPVHVLLTQPAHFRGTADFVGLHESELRSPKPDAARTPERIHARSAAATSCSQTVRNRRQ